VHICIAVLLMFCTEEKFLTKKLIRKELRNSTPVSSFLFGCLNKNRKCNYYRKIEPLYASIVGALLK